MSLENRSDYAEPVADMLAAETRPEPAQVAGLIADGLSREALQDTLQDLGHEVPDMPLTDREVSTVLPYIDEFSKQLATDQAGSPVWFLARDGEYLYDAYATRYPDQPAQLVPASMALLRSTVMRSGGEAPQSFLNSHDLGSVDDDEPKGLLVDTGFRGSAGYLLHKRISESSGEHYLQVARALPLGMVSMSASATLYDAPIRQVVDFRADERLANEAADSPRIAEVMGAKGDSSVPIDREQLGTDPIAWRVALALQSMPHHQGPYTDLAETATGWRAIAEKVPITTDVDVVPVQNANRYVPNPTHYNPVAALIVQREVVAAALER